MPPLKKKDIDSLKPESSRDVWLWDSEVVGLGLRCTPGGTKSFVLKYALGAAGRSRRVTLGRYGSPLTLDLAREEARDMLMALRKGEDPAVARARRKSLPTVSQLGERYLTEHAEPHKAPTSVQADGRMLNTIRKSPLGKIRTDTVTRADIAAFHSSRKHAPVDGNRILAMLSVMMNLAELWGYRSENTNPTKKVKRYPEQKRERYLSEVELTRLGDALRESDASPYAVAAIRLLVLTGARAGEVIDSARWSDVDLDRGFLSVPNPKEKKPKRIRLGPPAIAILEELPHRHGDPRVIPVSYSNVDRAWRTARKTAGIEDVRLHDLRHSFASVAVSGGASLPIIGALLGHKRASTTQRYAHLADDALKPTADTVSSKIDEAMRRREGNGTD